MCDEELGRLVCVGWVKKKSPGVKLTYFIPPPIDIFTLINESVKLSAAIFPRCNSRAQTVFQFELVNRLYERIFDRMAC